MVGLFSSAQQNKQIGLEWGIYESVVNGNCAPNEFTASGTALSVFNISVTCS